jgi:hypothetical protein
VKTFKPALHFSPLALLFIVASVVFASGINAQVNGGAIASFGLRKISTSYTGSAIEAQRCDGKTAGIGFTACGDLDTAALKTFALSGAPLSMITAAPSAAYSLRKLYCTYSGNLIRVRRSSDNTQQDIGFTNGADLDTVALKTFVGAGSGFIVTWYDQSGNGRNATQATAANQPRIVNAGVVHRQNGMPSINFRGASDYLNSTLTGVTASSGGGTITTVNIVAQSNSGVAGTILSNGDAGTNRYNIHMPWSDGTTYFDIGDISSGGRMTGIAPWTLLNTGTFVRNGSSAIIYRNAMPVTYTVTMSSAVTNTAALTIGGSPAYTSYMVGYISEMCVFPSALSTAERDYFEWNQSKYYGLIGGFNSNALPTTTLPSATVETWYDQTGNNRNMTEATATEQPVILNAGYVNRLNGLPAIVGSTANQVNLTGALGSTYTGTMLTAMTVVQADEMVAANRRVMSFSNGTASDWQNAGSFNVNQRGTGGTNLVVERSGTTINPTTTIAQSTPITLSVLFNGTNRQFYNDGTASATLADNQAFNYNNFRVLHSINPGFEATEGFNGRMTEFTIFHPVANNPRLSRRNLMESSQAAYYGITIAAASNKYAGPSSYNLHVNGIGRESATDTVLSTRSTAGMGLSATTAQYLQTNGDYMMIGTSCSASPGSISTSDLPGGTLQRWARDWYLDKTDLATLGGTVTIYFDFGDYGISTSPAGAATNYVLLYRSGTSGNYATTTISGTRTITGDRIVFTTNATNISDGYFTLGSTSAASPLPVELTTFEGNTCSNSVCLHWETATELNNAYFSIGRSDNAMSFDAIGKVDSKAGDGNSNTLLNYTFQDAAPLSGTSYYQLTQYDINGQSKKSKIISVNFDASRNVSFVVYPNPNQGEFSVDFSGLENNHELTVSMMDMQGKSVYHQVIDMQSLSSNTFKIIPDTRIPAGTYLVVFEVQGIKYTSKVIVE